jgi:hypothetical protein
MGRAIEQFAAQVFGMLQVRFADFAQEQAFQAGDALAVVGAELGQQPMRLPAATGAAVAIGGGAVGAVPDNGQ